MKYWQPYVKAGWEIVMEAQGKSHIILDTEVEAFLVHVIAKTMERTDIWQHPISLKILTAQSLFGTRKANALQDIGEECLFIDGWQIKNSKWPTKQYFADMGEIAFGMASTSTNPANELLEMASNNFKIMSSVLRTARNLNGAP